MLHTGLGSQFKSTRFDDLATLTWGRRPFPTPSRDPAVNAVVAGLGQCAVRTDMGIFRVFKQMRWAGHPSPYTGSLLLRVVPPQSRRRGGRSAEGPRIGFPYSSPGRFLERVPVLTHLFHLEHRAVRR